MAIRFLALTIIFFAYTICAQQAQVRVAHASPDAPQVDFVLNGTTQVSWNAVSYKNVTNYSPVNAGTYDVEIFVSGQLYTKFSSVDIVAYKAYTVTASGLVNTTVPAQNFTVVTLADTNTAPASQFNSRIRFYHAVSDAPAVDVRAAGDDEPLFANIQYKQASAYIEVASGTYIL